MEQNSPRSNAQCPHGVPVSAFRTVRKIAVDQVLETGAVSATLILRSDTCWHCELTPEAVNARGSLPLVRHGLVLPELEVDDLRGDQLEGVALQVLDRDEMSIYCSEVTIAWAPASPPTKPSPSGDTSSVTR